MIDSAKSPGELERVLRTPLPFSLGPADAATTAKIVDFARQQHLLVESLWQLFLSPRPPAELLILVRDFGKRHLMSPSSPYSRNVARLIYLASIAAAFVKLNDRITTLDDDKVLPQLRWAAEEAQVPEELRELFQTALEQWPHSDPPSEERGNREASEEDRS